MLTSGQIAKKLRMEIHTVRYRLGVLRHSGAVKPRQYGVTYAYSDSVVNKVKNFGK